MIEHNLKQGSAEWHAFRQVHFNASEAATMLGYANKYGTRDGLLDMKKLGTEKEFSEWTQKNILDKGHELESKARVILEREVGEEFYPVTGTHDTSIEIAASLDGITMMGDVLFEHKQWNKELVAYIEEHNDLPASHWPQLEQQLFVSGATFVYFVVSDGTKDKRKIFNYYSKPERLQEVLEGWEQFAIDLANYKPKAPVVEVIAQPKASLPSLSIQLTGEVSASNLSAYKEAALDVISNIKTELSTDQDFADAKETVKFCEKAEAELKNKKQQALEKTTSINELFNTIDELSEAIRQTRLKLNKSITAQDKAKKANLIADAAQEIQAHIDIKNAEFQGLKINAITVDLAAAIKNKRSYASMESSLNDAVAKAKIELNNNAKLLHANLAIYEESVDERLRHLFSDLQGIISNESEIFRSIVTARIADFEKHEASQKDPSPVEEALTVQPIEPEVILSSEAANEPITSNNPYINDINVLVDLRAHLDKTIYNRCNSDIAGTAVDFARMSVIKGVEALTEAICVLESDIKEVV